MNLQTIKLSKTSIAAIIVAAGLLAGFFLYNALKTFSLSEHQNAFLIMMLFAAVLIFPIFIAFLKKSFDPFEPVYLWIALYAFLYLAKPLTQIISGINFSYGAEFLDKALFVAILGLVCFYLGYYSSLGRKIGDWIPVIKSEISSKRLIIVAWIFIILGFLGFYYGYIRSTGGWEAFWLKPHGIGAQIQKSTAYIWEASELMVVGFILVSEIFIAKLIAKNIKLKDVLILLAAAVGGVGIYTIAWGSRTLYSWIFLALILIYFLKKGVRPKVKTIIAITLLLFLLLVFVPVYRQHLYVGGNFYKFVNDLNFKNFLNSAVNPGDEFNAYLAEIALVPDSVPYDNFSLYKNLPLYPIPRIIWPNKPNLLNHHWDEFLSKSGMQVGAAESMLGDFYAQKGIFGIIIGTLLSGIFWRTTHEYLKKAPQNRSVILIYAFLMPNLFSYIAQSALIGVLKWVPYMLPPVILALILSRRKKNS